MTAYEALKLSEKAKQINWLLSEENIKWYESLTAKPYGTEYNISSLLTAIINSKIQKTCKNGGTMVSLNLYNITDLQGWQIRQMQPYLQWYYMRDGYTFDMGECVVTISWENRIDETDKLPCKIGDPVWVVCRDLHDYILIKGFCCGFHIDENGILIITNVCCYDNDRMGNFVNEYEARKRLAELKGEGA